MAWWASPGSWPPNGASTTFEATASARELPKLRCCWEPPPRRIGLRAANVYRLASSASRQNRLKPCCSSRRPNPPMSMEPYCVSTVACTQCPRRQVRQRWLVSERARFTGQTVLITGAGSGIGRAIALRFAEEEADVAIHDINEEEAQATATQVREIGRRAETYKVDVSRPDEVRAAVATTIVDFGRLNVLVNDAGINIVKRPFDYTDEDWESVIGVNLTGTWNYCRYAGPHIASGGGGAIVNIASVAATIASYYRVPYMASKGGVGMLTKALAMDLAEMKVR